MATLTIRKLDDEVYARLRQQARANNRSLEAEARGLLEERTRDLTAFVDELEAFQADMIARHGLLPDSTPGIRAERDGE